MHSRAIEGLIVDSTHYRENKTYTSTICNIYHELDIMLTYILALLIEPNRTQKKSFEFDLVRLRLLRFDGTDYKQWLTLDCIRSKFVRVWKIECNRILPYFLIRLSPITERFD